MRWVTNIGALIVSVFLGYAVAIIVSSPTGIDPSRTPVPGPETTRAASRSEPGSTVPTEPATTITEGPQTYLIWSTGGLTPALTDGLVQGFDAVSVVKGDVVELETEDGVVIPLDAMAIDPEAHRPFDPTDSLSNLQPGMVVLGETSANLRTEKIGDVLRLGGTPFEIVGITPDKAVGAAEVVFDSSDPDLSISTDRFALVSTDSPRAEFEEFIRSLYKGLAPLRIRAEAETPWLRHGDAVLPQVFIKQALGEFSYTGRSGSEFIQDKEFLDTHIVETEVPILGRVVCHQAVADRLAGAMAQLVEEGLAHLVDPAGYRGCWNPRFIRSATGVPAGVSRHAWGAAFDINAGDNPIGSAGAQDTRLVEIMIDWGFTWGGDWLVPDPMHFEYGVNPG